MQPGFGQKENSEKMKENDEGPERTAWNNLKGI